MISPCPAHILPTPKTLSDDAKALAEVKKLPDAEQLLLLALELYPNSNPLLRRQGHIYKLQGKLAKAEKSLEKAINIDPEDTKSLHLLGMVYLKQDKFPEAEKKFRDILAIDDKSVAPYIGLTYTFAVQTEFAEAHRFLAEAMRLGPNLREVRMAAELLRTEENAHNERAIPELPTAEPVDQPLEKPPINRVAMLATLYFKAKKAFEIFDLGGVQDASLTILKDEFHKGAAILYIACFEGKTAKAKQSDPMLIRLRKKLGDEGYDDLQAEAQKLINDPARVDKHDAHYGPYLKAMPFARARALMPLPKDPSQEHLTAKPAWP